MFARLIYPKQAMFVNLSDLLQPALENALVRLWRHTEPIRAFINEPRQLGNLELTIAGVVMGLGIFLLALLMSRYMRAFLARRMQAHKQIDAGVQYTLLRLIHYLIITVGVLYALRTALGVDLTTLAVMFTAVSLGIGFGLQFIAGDIAAGFILLFERPVRVGDFISVAGPDNKITEGSVTSINLRTTLIVTDDQLTAIVPNSKLVNQNLINWSYAHPQSRIPIPVRVGDEADVDLVTQMLLRAAEGVDHVLEEPPPSVQFLGFGDATLDFRLLVWTEHPPRYAQIKSDIYYRIRRLFLEASIGMPSPPRAPNERPDDANQNDGRAEADRTATEEARDLPSTSSSI